MDQTTTERWDEITAADGSPAVRVELLRRFVRDDPDHGPAWARLGQELSELSRFDEAEVALRRAIDLARPRMAALLSCDMGMVFRRKGDYDTAEQWFRRAVELNPDDAAGHIYLGAVLARAGRLDEAEAAHRQGAACATGCVDEAHYNLGLVLRALGRYAEAEACFDRAVEIDPLYDDARLAKQDVQRAMAIVGSAPPAAAEPPASSVDTGHGHGPLIARPPRIAYASTSLPTT